MRINQSLRLLSMVLLLQACVAVNPGPSKDEKASSVNVELGIGYLQQNNFELASEKLNRALQQNPDSVKGHYIFAILQDRLGEMEKAEFHYERATSLDPDNSEAANNYGAFLCRYGRERDAEKYFLRAVKNPLYKTPEIAYANAGLCMLEIGETETAKRHLREALAKKSDFGVALVSLAQILFDEGEYAQAKIYLDRYHQSSRATPRSLWLGIRTELELGGEEQVVILSRKLGEDYPDSNEYQEWLKLQ